MLCCVVCVCRASSPFRSFGDFAFMQRFNNVKFDSREGPWRGFVSDAVGLITRARWDFAMPAALCRCCQFLGGGRGGR